MPCTAIPRVPGRCESLAREAGLSRSALAERFTQFVGRPPMQYLSHWRMQLAAGHLLERPRRASPRSPTGSATSRRPPSAAPSRRSWAVRRVCGVASATEQVPAVGARDWWMRCAPSILGVGGDTRASAWAAGSAADRPPSLTDLVCGECDDGNPADAAGVRAPSAASVSAARGGGGRRAAPDLRAVSRALRPLVGGAAERSACAQGDRVVVIAPNTHAMLEQFYAVPQLGAIVVPLNYRLSSADFRYMIDHCEPVVVCVHRDYIEAVEGLRAAAEQRPALRGAGGQPSRLARLRGAR